MKNQRGFLTIEIILVVLIISVLTTLVVPNFSKMIDVARLDYEMKILLSQIDYAYSLNKNIHLNPSIFENKFLGKAGYHLQINVDENLNRYTIVQDGKNFEKPHELPQGFSIKMMYLKNPIDISAGDKGHIIITSRHNFKRYVIRDNVGRWRGDMTPP